MLYFGSDRYDNSGDAQQGFWFFQNTIGARQQQRRRGTGFTGVHKTGDLLVISDFSNGGTTSTITVLQVGPDVHEDDRSRPARAGTRTCASLARRTGQLRDGRGERPVLRHRQPDPARRCRGRSPTRAATTTSLQRRVLRGRRQPVPARPRRQVLRVGGSETRSSTSTTATLKDFVLGQFARLRRRADDAVVDGTVSGVTGSATVSDSAAIKISGSTIAPTGSVTFRLGGPSATQITSCDSTGTLKATVNLNTAVESPTGTFTVGSGDVTVNTSGYYCWFASWPGDTNYVSDPPSAGFSDGSATECFKITQPTTLATTLHETNSAGVDVSPANNGTTITINAGGYVVDYANVTPSTATGSVVFRYFTDQTVCNAATASGGQSAGSGTVSGGSANGSTLQLASGTYDFLGVFDWHRVEQQLVQRLLGDAHRQAADVARDDVARDELGRCGRQPGEQRDDDHDQRGRLRGRLRERDAVDGDRFGGVPLLHRPDRLQRCHCERRPVGG